MDLRGGSITIRDLLRNPGAKAIMKREFPGLSGSPMFLMAQGMSLNKVIGLAGGTVPKSKIEDVIKQLKEL